MGKFLAFDIGEKRIGVAHSDEKGTFSFPLMTIHVDETLEKNIENIIQDENPEKIVVGLPRNMDGSLGFQAERVQKFAEKSLAKYMQLIEYEDETVTSIEAQKVMKMEGKDPRIEKDLIDAYAAKIILESYLRK